jgi:hypothetical protein
MEPNRHDFPIIILSILAVLAAGVLSMATITAKSGDKVSLESWDPYEMADQAANAGFEAAKWHIECHGRVKHGSISSHYFINGATYAAEWDDVDMQDSTVTVRCTGEATLDDDQIYRVSLESKLKITSIPVHTNDILDSYYSKSRPPVFNKE